MRRNLLTLLLLTGLSSMLLAQQQRPVFPYEEMDKAATDFFDAYNKADADRLVSLYADSMQWIDETYAAVSGREVKMQGKETMRNHYKDRAFQHVIAFDWNEENRFFSGNQGIFRGTVTVDYKGTIAGKPESVTYQWTAPYVMVMTFKDGKIVRLNDYLDYQAAGWSEKK